MSDRNEGLEEAETGNDWPGCAQPAERKKEEIIAVAQGRVDRHFWNSIYKWNGADGSGPPPYVSGWVLKMLPYLNPVKGYFCEKPGTPLLCRNEWLNQPPALGHGPGLDRFPQLPARAPFLWKYYEQQFDMEFVGGLLGIRQDPESLALRPEIGWAILDKQNLTQIRAEQAARERAQFEAERDRIERERIQAAERE